MHRRKMIEFEKYTLSNGLKVILHQDSSTPMAVLNVLYDVGSRDEHPDKTGFAHLFEHLMFGGSVNIPVYDTPLQKVGGQNNAFTCSDFTNYHVHLPAVNLETACWLESDRMLNLAFSEKSLATQKGVVCEEFKQRYLNQPYGDAWLKLRPLAYQTHPYQWTTIGKNLAHIEQINLQDVKDFFAKYYQPNNAIVVVAGKIDFVETKVLIEKWFAPIPAGKKQVRNLPKEPDQTVEKKLTVTGKVPANALFKAYRMAGRSESGYYAADLLSDILSRGQSARLYQSLVKEKGLFSSISSYLTAERDPALLVIEGKLSENVAFETAEKALNEILQQLTKEQVSEKELQKVKNKIETTLVFSDMSLLEKALGLAYHELLGDAALYNQEAARYQEVTAENLTASAKQLFKPTNCATLYYQAEPKTMVANSINTK